MFCFSNVNRPLLTGWRSAVILLMMKIHPHVKVNGWKYFFASLFTIRIEKGMLYLAPGCWFENNVLLHCISGELHIASKTFVNRGSMIVCKENIQIGEDVLIGDYVSIYDHDHGLQNRKEYTTKPVVLEDRVWIGSHSVVLKGVKVGEGSIVAAGSVVNKSIPSGELWGGVPAKFIKGL